MQTINDALNKLKTSKFRSGFKLSQADKKYVLDKGVDVIRQHASDFVKEKIGSAQPLNDGKQTPMNGHPVFKAMHATGCCCRNCLEKWYKVPKGIELTSSQQERIVNLLMAWINIQLNNEE